MHKGSQEGVGQGHRACHYLQAARLNPPNLIVHKNSYILFFLTYMDYTYLLSPSYICPDSTAVECHELSFEIYSSPFHYLISCGMALHMMSIEDHNWSHAGEI